MEFKWETEITFVADVVSDGVRVVLKRIHHKALHVHPRPTETDVHGTRLLTICPRSTYLHAVESLIRGRVLKTRPR